MHITLHQAVWLLIPALPMGLWIAWSDLSTMRIANKAVLILGAGFLVFGLIAAGRRISLAASSTGRGAGDRFRPERRGTGRRG